MHSKQSQFFSAGVIALALASSLLCLAQTPSKAPSPLCKFAGSWKEDESRRKSSSTITFRRDAQGNLEEVLAYGTLVNPVHFDGKPYSADSLKKTEAIAWKQLDKSHFERTFFDGGKPLGTTRYQISDDGKTLTTASDRTLADGRQNVSTGVFRRTKGEAQGLAATWQQVSFHSSVPYRVTYEAMGDRLKVSDDRGNAYTEALDEKPVVLGGPGLASSHTIALKLLDAQTIRETETIKGVPTVITTSVVSADGKMMKQTSVDPHGRRAPEVSVFEKQ